MELQARSDKWSIAECMEHIAAAEDFIRGQIEQNIMKAPAAPDRDIAKTDAGILTIVPDRSNKVQAPEPLKPTNRFASPQAAIKHFVESRATTEDFLKKTADLRGHTVDSPGGCGKCDAYEFILLIGAQERAPHQADRRSEDQSRLPGEVNPSQDSSQAGEKHR